MKILIKRKEELVFFASILFFTCITYPFQSHSIGTATIPVNAQLNLQIPADHQQVHTLLAQCKELIQTGNDVLEQIKTANNQLTPKIHKITDTVLEIFAAIKALPQDGFFKNSGRFCIAITGAAGPIFLLNGVNNAAQAINNYNDTTKRKEFAKKSALNFFISYVSLGITVTYLRN